MDAITCTFGEGPMHGQVRTVPIESLRRNGDVYEVNECPSGPITESPAEMVTHIYRWPSNNSLIYHGKKQ